MSTHKRDFMAEVTPPEFVTTAEFIGALPPPLNFSEAELLTRAYQSHRRLKFIRSGSRAVLWDRASVLDWFARKFKNKNPALVEAFNANLAETARRT